MVVVADAAAARTVNMRNHSRAPILTIFTGVLELSSVTCVMCEFEHQILSRLLAMQSTSRQPEILSAHATLSNVDFSGVKVPEVHKYATAGRGFIVAAAWVTEHDRAVS